jgi:hypothetical protein
LRFSLLALAVACQPATPRSPDLGTLGAAGLRAIDPATLEANTRLLASDALAGREPGTDGDTRAENYIADQFHALGLEPAGDQGSYFQAVALRRAVRDDAHSALVVNGRRGRVVIAPPHDVLLFADPRNGHVAIDGPLVFVGYGLSVPGYDDLAGVDLHGAIAVVYRGAPRVIGGKPVSSAQHAVLSDLGSRSAALRARGARAMITVYDPMRAERLAFDQWVPKVDGPSMAWVEHDVVGSLPALPYLTMTEEAADRIAGGPTFHAIWQQLDRGKPTRLTLDATASLTIAAELRDVTARNVLGVLRGSDPMLAKETVVYTAHHDHLGIGPAIDGDTIYNGALDNAIGVAGIIEIARAFVALPERPRRSILFLAVTAEERGLLGSDYYAAHPTVPLANIAADINIDGLNPQWEPHDIVALGAEHSTLAAHVAAAATSLGFAVSEDPEPEQVFFIRSDQYSFVKRGVVAVFPSAGYLDNKGGFDANRAISDRWSMLRYHRPGDEWQPEFRAGWAAREASFDFLLGLSVAVTAERPRWNPGDVFETLAGTAAPSAGVSAIR